MFPFSLLGGPVCFFSRFFPLSFPFFVLFFSSLFVHSLFSLVDLVLTQLTQRNKRDARKESKKGKNVEKNKGKRERMDKKKGSVFFVFCFLFACSSGKTLSSQNAPRPWKTKVFCVLGSFLSFIFCFVWWQRKTKSKNKN